MNPSPKRRRSPFQRMVNPEARGGRRVSIAVIAGVAALVWAMRDRFISLVVPREPERPTFRVAPPPQAAAATSEQDDLTVIAGIGPVYQSRLYAAGFGTLTAVAEASPAELANAAQVPEGRAADWVSKAVAMVGKSD